VSGPVLLPASDELYTLRSLGGWMSSSTAGFEATGKTAETEGAVERAYRLIKRDILGGALAGGARLKEEELAAAVGVSRTPVREALRRLSAEGLVDFERHQGAVVAHWSLEDIEEIFGLRAVLEPYAVGLAASRISAAQIGELARLADAMEAAGAAKEENFIDDISTLNGEFHKILVRASGNRRLVRMLSGLIEMPVVLRTFGIYSPEELQRSFGHHREIVAALRAGDTTWPATVMRSHVLAARNAYFAAARQA
jgi:DNA-binding GntR family transcriptional regulator